MKKNIKAVLIGIGLLIIVSVICFMFIPRQFVNRPSAEWESKYGSLAVSEEVLSGDIDTQVILDKILKDSGLDYPTIGNGNMMRWTLSRGADVYEVGLWGKVLNFIAVKPEILERAQNSFVAAGFSIDSISTYHETKRNYGSKDGYRNGNTVCNLTSNLTTADFFQEPEPGLIDINIECGDLTGSEGVAYPIDPERTKIATKSCGPLNEPPVDFCEYGLLTIKLDDNNCGFGYVCESLPLDAEISCAEKCKSAGYLFGDCYKSQEVSSGKIMGTADCPQYKYTFSYNQDNFNCWCHNEPLTM